TLQGTGGGAGGARGGLGVLGGEPDARTDADGAFSIDGVGTGSYTVMAQHPDYAQGTALVEVKDGPAATELRLAPGSVVSGAVVSETSAPLPGATVTLSAGGLGRGPMAAFGGDTTVSDETGAFRFTHVAAGRYALSASAGRHQTAPLDLLLQTGH